MSSKGSAAQLAPWESAVAGATGAVLANAIVYPLDMYENPSHTDTHRNIEELTQTAA